MRQPANLMACGVHEFGIARVCQNPTGNRVNFDSLHTRADRLEGGLDRPDLGVKGFLNNRQGAWVSPGFKK